MSKRKVTGQSWVDSYRIGKRERSLVLDCGGSTRSAVAVVEQLEPWLLARSGSGKREVGR